MIIRTLATLTAIVACIMIGDSTPAAWRLEAKLFSRIILVGVLGVIWQRFPKSSSSIQYLGRVDQLRKYPDGGN